MFEPYGKFQGPPKETSKARGPEVPEKLRGVFWMKGNGVGRAPQGFSRLIGD